MTKIILSGCCGKMGRTVTNIVSTRDDCQIVAGVDIVEDSTLGYPVFQSFSEVQVKADVIVDFSNPALLLSMLEYAKSTNTAVVISTTGLSDEQIKTVEEFSKEIPVFFSYNMSMGVSLLCELCKTAAKVLGNDFDIEIVEAHHNQKIDAPSGTALALADSINHALNDEYAEGRVVLQQAKGVFFENEADWDLTFKTYNELVKAYEIQKLNRKLQKDMEKGSLATQQKLKKFRDEELKKLKEKDKLTQYDVDRANQLYEIELKKLALQESQMNKSKMRLRRDSSGNYSYQFVADEESAENARQELEDAQYSLRQLDEEETKRLSEKQKQLLRDFKEYYTQYHSLTRTEQQEQAATYNKVYTYYMDELQKTGLKAQEVLNIEPIDVTRVHPDKDIPVYRYRLKITKKGLLKYFSHLDWQNTFHKVLARTGLRMAYTLGFNPTMKVSLGIALPLFAESEGLTAHANSIKVRFED